MEKAKLIIKYKGEYIVENGHNELKFISVPLYNGNSDFHNIDIFTSLLCFGYMDDNYGATRGFTYIEGRDVFERFDPDYMQEVDKNTFVYDLDGIMEYDEEFREQLQKSLASLPSSLEKHSYEEILRIASFNNYNVGDAVDEDLPFTFDFSLKRVDEDLLQTLKFLNLKITDKDVLLLYSGGNDSALAAVRLHNEGYNVYFIHFDNGAMRDADKPYLTFKNSFGLREGYYFDYRLRTFKIDDIFNAYFDKWKCEYGDALEDGTLTSEIRCLSCRMAMYTEALSYAKANGFKYMAEGARISQKFMLEQEVMSEKLKELAHRYGIELLFPVLHLEDDETEKNELLAAGFSAKGWESKCLLGRQAMDKSRQDEQDILKYYDENLKPKILQKIAVNSRYANENWYINDKS